MTTTVAMAPVPAYDPVVWWWWPQCSTHAVTRPPPPAWWWQQPQPQHAHTVWCNHNHHWHDDSASASMHACCDTTDHDHNWRHPQRQHTCTLRCGQQSGQLVQGWMTTTTIWTAGRMDGVHLSEGRGQNNQQPTPNDNNKRVVVFLCGSGIWSPQGDVLQAFRQGAGGKGRASDGEYMRLVMVLTPLQPTTVVRRSPGVEQWWWNSNRGVIAVMEQRGSKGTVPASRMRWTVMGWSGLMS